MPVKTLRSTGSKGGWTHYTLYLGNFVSPFRDGSSIPVVTAFSPQFTGCGNSDVNELTQIEFSNGVSGQKQDICLDELRMLG